MDSCSQNPFDQARVIEARGMVDIIPFLKEKSYEGRYVVTNKGALSEMLQKTVGDVLMNTDEDKIWGVEIKTEEQNLHNNFFLEVWSNKKRHTAGWMITLQADILLYYFQKERDLYSISIHKLKHWAFDIPGRTGKAGRIWDYEEKPQNKYTQKNDTWGRCVPIPVIEKEVGFVKYEL